jgi:hypothetical protein
LCASTARADADAIADQFQGNAAVAIGASAEAFTHSANHRTERQDDEK